jgi:hypothetical protein
MKSLLMCRNSVLLLSVLMLGACDRSSETSVAPSPSESAAQPEVATPQAPVASSPAVKYDGKIVHQPDANRGKDDGWFLVKDGKKRWITDAKWLEPNGYKAADVIYITSEEFSAIPEDCPGELVARF